MFSPATEKIFPAAAAEEVVRYEHDSIKAENGDKIRASPFRQATQLHCMVHTQLRIQL